MNRSSALFGSEFGWNHCRMRMRHGIQGIYGINQIKCNSSKYLGTYLLPLTGLAVLLQVPSKKLRWVCTWPQSIQGKRKKKKKEKEKGQSGKGIDVADYLLYR